MKQAFKALIMSSMMAAAQGVDSTSDLHSTLCNQLYDQLKKIGFTSNGYYIDTVTAEQFSTAMKKRVILHKLDHQLSADKKYHDAKNTVDQILALQPDQDNSQKILDELEAQVQLQNLRIHVGEFTGDTNLMTDEFIQKEKIMQTVYKHKKDELSSDNPLRSVYDELINIRREIAEELSTLPPDDSEISRTGLDTRLNNKISEWVDSGKIAGLNVDMNKKDPYLMALYAMNPDLVDWECIGSLPTLSMFVSNPQPIKDCVTDCDQEMKELADKYPDIEEQRLDVYKKWWAYDLNSGIQHLNSEGILHPNDWIGNIKAGLQKLYDSKTQTGQAMVQTVLNTLSENLMGEDQDLKEKTKTLLQQDPALDEIVFVAHED